ncbi:unnamed protein product [Prorocentrum cordatum]|uniref:Uncharacterized protein n=1 Tax=Prorocentrum cordatum TaxID=2364126 RepID=A0ABN9S846_9DINO|nr:unnamed protein product [Polarella glacialis]
MEPPNPSAARLLPEKTAARARASREPSGTPTARGGLRARALRRQALSESRRAGEPTASRRGHGDGSATGGHAAELRCGTAPRGGVPLAEAGALISAARGARRP